MTEENSKVKININDEDAKLLRPISLEMLRSNCPFDFNVYVKILEKFVLYVKKGDDIEDERLEKFKRIQKLKEKDVERLFVHSTELDKISNYIDAEIDEALDEDNDIEEEERFDRIQHIATSAVECCFSDPDTQEAFDLVEKAAKGLRKVVSTNPKAMKKIFHRRGRKTDIVQEHCKNVAALSLKMAFSLGFRGEDLDNLGTAALLHDIGINQMTQDDIDILFKRPIDMFKGDDKRIYENHVKQGMTLIGKKDYINNKILKLIESHEEQLDGKGYPKRTAMLDPLEQILGLCNKYDKRVTAQGMKPVEAYNDLQTSVIGQYELKYIKKLLEVLKAEEIVS